MPDARMMLLKCPMRDLQAYDGGYNEKSVSDFSMYYAHNVSFRRTGKKGG
jgi:hypothetical protein